MKVSGKTGCGAVSGDNAATGSVAACAGCGCGNRHDRDRLASGRTSRDGCLDRRLSLFPDLRRAPDLQPVFAAASSGVLDDGNERHRGSDGGSLGLQQHAAAHLRQVDAAHRNVSVAGVCHHELSGAVSDGRAVCADGSLGRRCTDRVLFDRTGGVESGSEELYVGKHVRSQKNSAGSTGIRADCAVWFMTKLKLHKKCTKIVTNIYFMQIKR